MKKLYEKVLSLILTAVLLLSFVVTGFANDMSGSIEDEPVPEYSNGLFIYKIKDGKAYLINTEPEIADTYSGTLTIPATLGGYPLASIVDDALAFLPLVTAFVADETSEYFTSDENGVLFNKNKTVILQYPQASTAKVYAVPDSVKTISPYAFAFNTSLEQVTFSENSSLTLISSDAFKKCTSLKSFSVPDKVTKIGIFAFYECTSLESVTFGENSRLDRIENGAFIYCESLKEFVAPQSLTHIGGQALAHCSSLTSVEFSADSKLTEIEGRAFENSDGLTEIYLPASVSVLGKTLFMSCDNIEAVNVDEANAVYSSVNGVLFDKAQTVLLEYPHKKTDSDYTVPDGVHTINTAVFSGNEYLVNVSLPDSIKTIGESAFEACENLTTVTASESIKLETLGDFAFRDCTGLVSVRLGSSLKSIGTRAFYNCYLLENIGLGEDNKLETIGDSAFSDCRNLKEIHLPDSLTHIGQWAFNCCKSLTEINIPSQLESISLAVFYGCSNLTGDIVIPDGITEIRLYAFKGCSKITSLTVPASVTTIGAEAFMGCYRLKSINFAENSKMETVNNGAFNYCTSLTEITLPETVTYIGSTAFADCEKLEKISIPDTVERIGDSAFTNTAHFKNKANWDSNAYYAGNHLIYSNRNKMGEKLVIREGTKTVATYFLTRDCESLKSIYIPKSLAVVNFRSFYGCKNVEKVYYAGSEEDFKNIKIDASNDFLFSNIEYNHVHEYTCEVTEESNCTKEGKEQHTCICGHEYYSTIPTDETAHSFGEWTVTTQPTTTQTGTKERSCIRCGETQYETVPVKPGVVYGVDIPEAITVNYKKSFELIPLLDCDSTADYRIMWESSDLNVIVPYVDGEFSAIGTGTATITCTVTDAQGNEFTDTCTVTVKYTFLQLIIKYILFGWLWF